MTKTHHCITYLTHSMWKSRQPPITTTLYSFSLWMLQNPPASLICLRLSLLHLPKTLNNFIILLWNRLFCTLQLTAGGTNDRMGKRRAGCLLFSWEMSGLVASYLPHCFLEPRGKALTSRGQSSSFPLCIIMHAVILMCILHVYFSSHFLHKI